MQTLNLKPIITESTIWGVRLEVARLRTQGFKYFPSEIYSSAHSLHLVSSLGN